jgi:hypothetical protein
MIEPIMYFAIGFLGAALLGLQLVRYVINAPSARRCAVSNRRRRYQLRKFGRRFRF